MTWYPEPSFAHLVRLSDDTRHDHGLGPMGCSENQGAESTLALLSTLQHGRNVPRQAYVH